MYQDLKNFYLDWKSTAIGKAVRDFFYSVAASAILAGMALAADAVLLKGELNPQAIVAAFLIGCTTGAAKAVSLFVDKYRDPRVPNTPQ